MRQQACLQLEERARQISLARGTLSTWQLLGEHSSVPCVPHLTQLFKQSIEEMGSPLLMLPSGAGHDAAILSELTDIAMLFVRCRGGISHHPSESVTASDVAVAIKVLERFLQLLSNAVSSDGSWNEENLM